MLTFGVVSLLALLAIWIGYPVVVRLLAALRGAPAPLPETPLPSVSVILASHDEPAAIEARGARPVRRPVSRRAVDGGGCPRRGAGTFDP